eukprot:1173952-Prymnesium_polylepis.1
MRFPRVRCGPVSIDKHPAHMAPAAPRRGVSPRIVESTGNSQGAPKSRRPEASLETLPVF